MFSSCRLIALLVLLLIDAHGEAESPLYVALGAKADSNVEVLRELRRLRNSRAVLEDPERIFSVTGAVEQAMRKAYTSAKGNESVPCPEASIGAEESKLCMPKAGAPGNFHGVKSHSYYVSAISEAHPSLPYDAVQSIVASEWYHPGLTAKSVWCVEGCGAQFPLARILDMNHQAIQEEVQSFWRHPDALLELKGVGSHTTKFDRMIAGNGTWVDVRLWRGRAFNRHLCEKHFRTICSIVEASPEIWTNPWSHVLLSVLLADSWAPFHQGHTNGQLTYHLPVSLPVAGDIELALVERGGSLPDDTTKESKPYEHPEEHISKWKEGNTLVFDDSFTHAVRFRGGTRTGLDNLSLAAQASTSLLDGVMSEARVVLLMRGWHPELGPEERAAVREFVRKGGEEDPEGYDMLPISPGVFQLHSN